MQEGSEGPEDVGEGTSEDDEAGEGITLDEGTTPDEGGVLDDSTPEGSSDDEGNAFEEDDGLNVEMDVEMDVERFETDRLTGGEGCCWCEEHRPATQQLQVCLITQE